jgi:site-specific DNA-methyltransferase (adenine-specific)
MNLPFNFPHWKSPDEKIILFNCNYEELFSLSEDKIFNVLISDPPYGIGAGKNGFSTVSNSANRLAIRKNYGPKDWDSKIPPEEYFTEAKRVSKNQIIWGGNYFLDYLGATNCFLIWDKVNGNWSNADCEIAWTSFKTAIRKFSFVWNGMLQGDMKNKEFRIHPTQKPVQLYKWVLLNYCEQGDLILDTHLGSGSIAVAVDSVNKIESMNLTLVACELDPEIYQKSIERIKNDISKNIDYRSDQEKSIQKSIFE